MIRDWQELEGLVEFTLPRKTLVSIPDYPAIHPRINFDRDKIQKHGGVRAQALYALAMRTWAKDQEFQRQRRFLFEAITQEHFQIDQDWVFSEEDLRLVRDVRYDFVDDDWRCVRRVYVFSRIRLMGVFFDLMEEFSPKRHLFHGGTVRPGGDTPRDRIFFSEAGGPLLTWEDFQEMARVGGWLKIWLKNNRV